MRMSRHGRVLLGTILAAGIVLASILAKGFHWL